MAAKSMQKDPQSMREQLKNLVGEGNLPNPEPKVVEAETQVSAGDDLDDLFAPIPSAQDLTPVVASEDSGQMKRLEKIRVFVTGQVADKAARYWEIRRGGDASYIATPGFVELDRLLRGFLRGQFPGSRLSAAEQLFARGVAQKAYARISIPLLPADREVFQDFVEILVENDGLRHPLPEEVEEHREKLKKGERSDVVFFGEIGVLPKDLLGDPEWFKEWQEILQVLIVRWNNTVRVAEKGDFNERKMALLEAARKLAGDNGLIRGEELVGGAKRDGFSFLILPHKAGFNAPNGKWVEGHPMSALTVEVFSDRGFQKVRIVDAISTNPGYEVLLKGLVAEKTFIPANQVGQKDPSINKGLSRSFQEQVRTLHYIVRDAVRGAEWNAKRKAKTAGLRNDHRDSIHQFVVERKAGSTEVKVSGWEYQGEDGKFVIDPLTKAPEVIDFSVFLTRDVDDNVEAGIFGAITVDGITPEWAMKKFPALGKIAGKTYTPRSVTGEGLDSPLKQILSVTYGRLIRAEHRRSEKAAADAAKAAEAAAKSEESGETQAVVSAA